MSKHGTASEPVVPGWYVEFQQAALRALPRDIDRELADNWRANGKGLAQAFREALIPLGNRDRETAEAIIRVDRTVRPVYPSWAKVVMHPEFEATGPAEYNISAVKEWLHDEQKGGSVEGKIIFQYLKETNAIKDHLGIADLLAIQTKGIDFFRKHFAGKAVFGWKSVVRDSDDYLRAPYLAESGDKVVIHWDYLSYGRSANFPALRFINTDIIVVDRTVNPSYPDWANLVMHPEFERSGPAEYDISAVERWFHDKQMDGYIGGKVIYDHLRETDALKDQLGLLDLLAIQAKGAGFFQKYFAGMAVYGWKSVVRSSEYDYFVPYLFKDSRGVVILWSTLGGHWHTIMPALRFVSVDSVIKVDRTVRPAYPNWVNEVMHPEFERSGPAWYNIGQVKEWYRHKQQNGNGVEGHEIYDYLKNTGALKVHLGLADLLAIQAKGIDFFRKHFSGKAVFGWKSVVRDRDDNALNVPCLIEREGEVIVHWRWLDLSLGSNNPALCFV